MVSKALPAKPPCALLLTTAPFGPEVDDGATIAFDAVVDEPGEGGEGDARRAGVADSERAGEAIGEGLPHVGAEGGRRGRGGGRGLGRRGRCPLPVIEVVPNFVPKIGPIVRKYLFRRRDSNPD